MTHAATQHLHALCCALMAQDSAAAAVSSVSANAANSAWMAAGFILLAVGIGIAAVELFVPSGGLLAAAAATALVGSIVCFFMYDTLWGAGALVLYLAGSPIAIVLGLKLWTHTPLAKRMVLGGTDDLDWEPEDGAPQRPAHETRVGVGAAGSSLPVEKLVGQTGLVVTTMRPVGFVRIGAERIEAHAESGMIESGTRVTVLACDGARVVVRPIAEER